MKLNTFARFFARLGLHRRARTNGSRVLPRKPRRPALELLEDRTVFSATLPPDVLPTPVVNNPTALSALGGVNGASGDEGFDPAVAVDPTNSKNMVEVNAVTTANFDQLDGSASTDGGLTWTDFALNIPLNVTDPTSTKGLPYSVDLSPAASFDRMGNVYVVVNETNAGATSGAIVFMKFNFDDGFPSLDPVTPNTDPVGPGEQVLYQWDGQDPASNPTIAIDNNVASFSDPQNPGLTQTDTMANAIDSVTGSTTVTNLAVPKGIFVAWDDQLTEPKAVGGTSTDVLLAASGDGGLTFSTQQFLGDDPVFESVGSAPQLVFTQGTTANAAAGTTADVPGGQLNVFSNDLQGDIDLAQAQPDGGVASADAVSVAADFTYPAQDFAGKSTTDIPITITTPQDFGTVSDIEAVVAIDNTATASLEIDLIPPTGSGLSPVQLLNAGGVANSANFGVQNGDVVGVTFDDNALRSINDGSAASPWVGHFESSSDELAFNIDGATAAQVNGTWTLEVVDSSATGGTVEEASLQINSLFDGSEFASNNTIISGALPGSASNTYPTTAAGVNGIPSAGANGIGPGVSVAIDNTLGGYSPYQGRIYVAYTELIPAVTDVTGKIVLVPAYTQVEVQTSDDDGVTWADPNPNEPFVANNTPSNGYNTDTQSDNFSNGDRSVYQPDITVDPVTGTVAISYYDVTADASRLRASNSLQVSIDGGIDWSTPATIGALDQATDAITGSTVTVSPLPGNAPNAGAFGFGDETALVAYDGQIEPFFASNLNSTGTNIYTADVQVASGPRVLYADEGPVDTDFTYTPTNPTFGLGPTQPYDQIIYNNTFSVGNEPATANGTRGLSSFVVVFDRPVDVSTFTPAEVTMMYQDTAGDAPEQIPIAEVVPLDAQSQFGAQVVGGDGTIATQFEVFLGPPGVPTTYYGLGAYSYVIGPSVSSSIPWIPGGTPAQVAALQRTGPLTSTLVNGQATTVLGGSYMSQNGGAPATASNATYASTDTPLVAPGLGGSTTSVITVNNTYDQIQQNAARLIEVTATFVVPDPSGVGLSLDVDLELIAPDGTTITLSNLPLTTDASGTAVADVTDTAAGTSQSSVTPLAVLQNLVPNGAWQLVVTNADADDVTLTGWTLSLPLTLNAFAAPDPTDGVPFQLPYAGTSLPLIVTGPYLLSSAMLAQDTTTAAGSSTGAAYATTTQSSLDASTQYPLGPVNGLAPGGSFSDIISIEDTTQVQQDANNQIRVEIDLTLSMAEDLDVRLVAQDGTAVTLLDGLLPAGDDDYTFQDNPPAGSSAQAPVTPLSALINESTGGDWKLVVTNTGSTALSAADVTLSNYTLTLPHTTSDNEVFDTSTAGVLVTFDRDMNVGINSVSTAAANGLVTVTTGSPNAFTVGEQVTISGATPAAYDGTFTVAGVLSPTQFQFSAPGLTMPATSLASAEVGTFTSADVLGATGPVGPVSGNFTVTPGTELNVGVASAVASAGGTVTVTTKSPFAFLSGQLVTISGLTPASFNGTFAVTVTDSTHFTYSDAALAGAQYVGNAAVPATATAATIPAAEVHRVYLITFPTSQTLNGTYTLTLSQAIQDASGDELDSDHNAGLDLLEGTNPNGVVTTTDVGSTGVVNTTIRPGASVASPLTFTDAYQILQSAATGDHIQVQLNIQIAHSSDLTAYLQAPDGTQIPLFTNVGAGQHNPTPSGFLGTILDDYASTPIQQGVPPYSSLGAGAGYNPQQPLSSLVGKSTAGTWYLILVNNSAETGVLKSWSLTLPHGKPDNGLGDAGDTATVAFRIFNENPTNPATEQSWAAIGPAGINGGETFAAVAAASETKTTVTITTSAANNFTVGQQVTISGVVPAGYNGNVTITGVISPTQFTYTAAAGLKSPATDVSNGLVEAVSGSGNAAESGPVNAIAVDPADPTGNTVYVGSATGGLWKTTDFLTTSPDGPTYVPLTNMGPGGSLNIDSIAIYDRNNDPNDSIIYALTGNAFYQSYPGDVQQTADVTDGVGILESTNGGQTWTILDSSHNDGPGNVPLSESSAGRDHLFVGLIGNQITVDPTPLPNGGIVVYAAFSDGTSNTNGGLYRSTDGGADWTADPSQNNGYGVANVTEAGTTVTITLGQSSDLTTGQKVTVTGVTPAGYDGTFTVTVVNPTHLSYTAAAGLTSPATSFAGATVQAVATPVMAGNATSVVLAPTSADANGNLQTLYAGFQGNGIYYTTSATAATSLIEMAGGAGVPENSEVNDDFSPPQAVTVAAPASSPNGANGRIVLAAPPETSSPVENVDYQGWLYAVVANATESGLDGLFVTKDYGRNWTKVDLAEYVNPVTGQASGTNDTTNDTGDTTYNPLSNSGGIPSISLAVDPNDPNIVYLGGSVFGFPNLVRLDLTNLADAYSDLPYNNIAGGATAANSTELKTTGAVALDISDSAGVVDVFNSDDTPETGPSGSTSFTNLLRDPNNPFTSPSTLQVEGIDSYTNTGAGAFVDFYDDAADMNDNTILQGSGDLHTILTMKNPVTGQTELLVGDTSGVFTGTVADAYTLETQVGVVPVINGSRNGNLQIAQMVDSAAQPSELAASISDALFYGITRDAGTAASAANILDTGNLNWDTSASYAATGEAIATDPTGTGQEYEYAWPLGVSSPLNSTDFFLVTPPGGTQTSRTTGLPANNRADFPGSGGYRFATNPNDSTGLLIASATGGIFRSYGNSGDGKQWSPIETDGAGGVFGGEPVTALAFGAPDPTVDSNLDDFVYGGSANGQVWVTFSGGGANSSWTNISNGLPAGSTVEQIVADPRQGTHDAYAVVTGPTSATSGVFYMPDSTASGATWQKIDDTAGYGSLFNLTTPVFNGTNNYYPALTDLTSIAVDWRFAVPVNPSDPNSPAYPVVYVAGNGGVYRTEDNGLSTTTNANITAGWTPYPDTNLDGAGVEGGGLPHVDVTSLQLVTGNTTTSSGLPQSTTGYNLLVAGTFGEGDFAIRLDDSAVNKYATVPIAGPQLASAAAFAGPGTLDGVTVTFNGPVDPQTVTLGDFSVTDPSGKSILLETVTDVTPTPAAGQANEHNVYQITFAAPQTAIGSYKVAVGNVTDYAGDGGPVQAATFSYPAAVPTIVVDVPGKGVEGDSGNGFIDMTPTADASVAATDPKGDVVAEFPGLGLFEYTTSNNQWSLLTTTYASQLAMDATGDVFGVFGVGLFEHTASGAWAELTGSVPSNIAVDAAGDVAGVFSVGLYEYKHATGTWTQLDKTSPAPGIEASMVGIDTAGDVFADFPTEGVWEYTAAKGKWAQLLTTDATALAVDASGDLAVELPGAAVPGVYFLAAKTTTPTLLSSDQASRLTIDATGDVVAQFPDAGVEEYASGGNQFTSLTTSNATLVAADNGGNTDAANDVVLDAAGSGVERYEQGAGPTLTQLNTAVATVLASDSNGDVAAVVGGVLERYRDATATWEALALPTKLQGATPYLVGVNGAGSVTAAFQNAGLWQYTDVGGWKELNSVDPEVLAEDGNGDVAASFPGYGVFEFSGGSARQLTGSEASLLAVDALGDVTGEFSVGLYRHTGAGWALLTGSTATQIGMDAAGDVVGNFAPGVYEYNHSTGAFSLLTAANPLFLTVNGNGDVIANFGDDNVQRYRSFTPAFQTIASATGAIQLLAGDNGGSHANDYLAADFAGSGLSRYEDVTGWVSLNTPDASAVAVNENGDVAAVFSTGVSLYRDATGLVQLPTPAALTGLTASEIGIDAVGDVVAEFQGAGVWEHTAAGGWRRLTGTDVEAGSNTLAVSANGDVVGAFSVGVYRYTPAAGFSQLSPQLASVVATDSAGDVAMLLAAGVYRYQDATSPQLQPLSTAGTGVDGFTPILLGIATNGSVTGEFPGQGVWQYANATGWGQLYASDAGLLVVDGAGDVVIDVSGSGIYRIRNGVATNINTNDPIIIAG
jgi:subtilisin-like proprotein convertase family protein